MISRRTRAVLDLLGNLVVVGMQLVFHIESSRIERLRREGSLEEIETGDSCTVENCDMDLSDARTAFALGAIAGEMPTVRTDWFLIGVVSGVLNKWLYDHDVAGIRRSRIRRWILIGCGWVVVIRIGLDDQDRPHSFGLGSSVGGICYRLKYGILNDLPDE